MDKKYYKGIELIRLLSCIAVILYHLGLLKGGYLAVCTFFVISGYLSIVSLSNKEFSFKNYYINKIKKLYLPLLLVVFITILIVSLIPSINWINLKPETTSVLLGYNNFWQLNANLDYFVRNVESPFMHLWYISILLQIDLVFPFIYLLFKKLSKKIHKSIPNITLIILSLASFGFFYYLLNYVNIMSAYYNTFARLFSFLLGALLGYMHINNWKVLFKDEYIVRMLFTLYIFILIALFIFVDNSNPLFSVSMLITTIISMRLIGYSTTFDNELNILDKIITSLSKYTYEIYLVQYPVIFLMQDIKIDFKLKIVLIILITFIISVILHFSYSIKKKDKLKIIKLFVFILLSISSLFGLYKYIRAKDYIEDMKKLEENLENNRIEMEKKKKEYEEKLKQENNNFQNEIDSLNLTDEQIKEKARQLRVVGIGDSIMELCVKELYEVFPNGYFDAATNRTEYQAIGILRDLRNKNILGDIVILNVGTNGQCLDACKDELMDVIKDKKVFWLNATNPDFRTFNPSIEEVANKYSNVHIIDWVNAVKDHPDYLIYDRVHPSVRGRSFYANTIFNSVYEEYSKELKKKKEDMLKEHDEYEKKKITFIGNDLLIGLFDYIKDDYDGSEFIMDKDLTYDNLVNKIKDTNINNKVVFIFDNTTTLNRNNFNKIKEQIKDKDIYIVDINNVNLKDDKINIIDFRKEYKEFISLDRIHMKEEGNKKLDKLLEEKLKQKN